MIMGSVFSSGLHSSVFLPSYQLWHPLPSLNRNTSISVSPSPQQPLLVPTLKHSNVWTLMKVGPSPTATCSWKNLHWRILAHNIKATLQRHRKMITHPPRFQWPVRLQVFGWFLPNFQGVCRRPEFLASSGFASRNWNYLWGSCRRA